MTPEIMTQSTLEGVVLKEEVFNKGMPSPDVSTDGLWEKMARSDATSFYRTTPESTGSVPSSSTSSAGSSLFGRVSGVPVGPSVSAPPSSSLAVDPVREKRYL